MLIHVARYEIAKLYKLSLAEKQPSLFDHDADAFNYSNILWIFSNKKIVPIDGNGWTGNFTHYNISLIIVKLVMVFLNRLKRSFVVSNLHFCRKLTRKPDFKEHNQVMIVRGPSQSLDFWIVRDYFLSYYSVWNSPNIHIKVIVIGVRKPCRRFRHYFLENIKSAVLAVLNSKYSDYF